MLNDSQKRKVSIALSDLEENLSEIEDHLKREDRKGVLFDLSNDIPLPEQRAMLFKIASIKRDIKKLSEQFGLHKQFKKLSSRIYGETSALWASVAEIKTGHLRGYGGVAERLEKELDPALEAICQELLEIQHYAGELNRNE